MVNQAGPRIGMSLSPRYLAGQGAAMERDILGPVDGFLADLRELSVSSIELRAISTNDRPELALAAAERVWDAGLNVTIHGALPPDDDPGDPEDDGVGSLPALVALVRRLGDRADSLPGLCPITVHAYAQPRGDAGELDRRSVARLEQLARWIDREQAPVVLAVELNRVKATVDPCVTYDGVLAVVDQVNHPRVGACWDFGHTWANVLRADLPAEAPRAFRLAVVHTHIHDLGASGRTHWPLTEQRLPLERFVSALVDVGYAGVWHLELSPDRFAGEGAARERALASVERLAGMIHAADPGG